MKPALAAFVALVIASLAGSGCSITNCTEIGCQSSLTFDFDGESLTAGDYQITVLSSSGEASCDVTIHENNGVDADCSGDFELEPSVVDVVVYDTPDEASLVVTRGGEEVSSAEGEPDYSDYYPNGPGCDDVACQVAFITAELDDSEE